MLSHFRIHDHWKHCELTNHTHTPLAENNHSMTYYVLNYEVSDLCFGHENGLYNIYFHDKQGHIEHGSEWTKGNTQTKICFTYFL